MVIGQLGQIWRYRWQIWLDIRKELLSDSRETMGRYFWVLTLPLFPLLIYFFIASIRVFPEQDHIGGVPYVVVGATFWFLFAGVFLSPLHAIMRKGRTCAQSHYPLVAAVVSAAGVAWIEFFIRALLCGLILSFTQWPTPSGVAGVLAVAIPLSLLFLGAGVIVGVLAVAFRDLEKLVPIVLSYVFFLSHVLFALPEEVVPRWVAWMNPFAFAVDTTRWYVMFGELPSPWVFGHWCIFGFVLCVKALDFLGASEPLLAEHL